MEFKINPNNVAEENASDYNRFEQNDYMITSASDNLFNNPGQIRDKNNVVTHNQYGMRWYLFIVWGFLIYYFITTVISGIKYIMQVDAYFDMAKRWDSAYYKYLFAVMLITAICEFVLAYMIFRARAGLLAFKKRSIKDLYTCLIFPGVYTVLFLVGIILMAASEDKGSGISMVTTLFSSEYIFKYGGWKYYLYAVAYIGIVLGNIKYFNNRKHLFVN